MAGISDGCTITTSTRWRGAAPRDHDDDVIATAFLIVSVG
jgi:hypothetical protein